MKIGRNDPCPCKSGKKFKKCCLPKDEHLSKKLDSILEENQQRENLYGKVKPIISADFQKNKFVAVDSTLHHSKKWKTFPDFLLDYIKTVLGSEWGNSELAKPETERHQMIKWFTDSSRYRQKQPQDGDGIHRAIPNGSLSAYMALAYDLYILKHHATIQKDIVRRLKIPDQFQGARYELFATATCIRAGFNIAFEDERDRTKKHPEFVATHKETGQQISVEAKSKKSSIKIRGAGQLINKALEKETQHPMVIFLDLNLPYNVAKKELETPPPNRVSKILDQVIKGDKNEDRYAMIIFTNQPYQYAKDDQLMFPKHVLSIISQNTKIPASHPEIFPALNQAALQDHIPNEFPKEE
ncbi:MAG: motif family protein [Candidatus Berkelbacteria bacterium]|nr:motif family protein [Candidatus Berkelbacteria bacterium]